MTSKTWRTGFAGLCATIAIVLCMVVVASAQTSMTTSTPGASSSSSMKLSGTVVAVQGGQLLVKLSNGMYRVFTPPADRKFTIDGKEVGLNDLQPGTTLHATYTEVRTPVSDRTVDTVEGTVWYAKGPTVILTLSNGENHQYLVEHDSPVKFWDNNNKEITVFDMKKGMLIHATKITEAERVEFDQSTVVTGSAPAAAAAAPMASDSGAAPSSLPHTGSFVPLAGLLGLVFSSASFVIRRYRLFGK